MQFLKAFALALAATAASASAVPAEGSVVLRDEPAPVVKREVSHRLTLGNFRFFVVTWTNMLLGVRISRC